MTPTTAAEKVKEIVENIIRFYCDHRLYKNSNPDIQEVANQWAATEEGSRLVGELGEVRKDGVVVRSEQEIRESLAEMERMITMAEKALDNSTVKQTPFLLEKFAIWKERSSARVSILKWVLGLPYLDEPNPILPEPPKIN